MAKIRTRTKKQHKALNYRGIRVLYQEPETMETIIHCTDCFVCVLNMPTYYESVNEIGGICSVSLQIDLKAIHRQEFAAKYHIDPHWFDVLFWTRPHAERRTRKSYVSKYQI